MIINPEKIPNIIRKPLFVLLNLNPELKQIIKKLFIKYFSGIHDTGKDNIRLLIHDNDFNTNGTFCGLFDFVLEKNTSNVYQTLEVNRLVLALKEKNHRYLEMRATEINFHNLVISSYLYLLRRYPSQMDIDLWTDRLAEGATVYTILNTLKNSLEFQTTGAYYLKTVSC